MPGKASKGTKPGTDVKSDIRFPSWLDLLTSWMENEAHYGNKTCVVFAHPVNHIDEVRKHFGARMVPNLINCEYAILVCDDEVTANRICNATPDSKPYTLVFVNGKLTNENS